MRLYLDTNVYSMAAELGDVEALRASCRRRGIHVLASTENLFELLAIPSADDRRRELAALIRIADDFEPTPLSYRHAMEVLFELRRLRPAWVRSVRSSATYRQAMAFLAAHRERWHQARRGDLPGPDAFAVYRRDAEAGISMAREYQRSLKEMRQEGPSDVWLLAAVEGSREAVAVESVDLHDADRAWRLDCLQVWHNAIVLRAAASRDYADYVGPYLKDSAFIDEQSTASLWLHEVDPLRVPLNRICGLATYFQLNYKIGHGNPCDSLHACHLRDADLFVTADRAFFGICQAIANRTDKVARVALIDRAAVSTVSEIERVATSG